MHNKGVVTMIRQRRLAPLLLTILLAACSAGTPKGQPNLLWTSDELPAQDVTAPRVIDRVEILDVEDGLRLTFQFNSPAMIPEDLDEEVVFNSFPITETSTGLAMLIRDGQYRFFTSRPVDVDHQSLQRVRTESTSSAPDVHFFVVELREFARDIHVAQVNRTEEGVTLLILNCTIAGCPPVLERVTKRGL